jgi:hypothetical protein
VQAEKSAYRPDEGSNSNYLNENPASSHVTTRTHNIHKQNTPFYDSATYNRMSNDRAHILSKYFFFTYVLKATIIISLCLINEALHMNTHVVKYDSSTPPRASILPSSSITVLHQEHPYC